MIRILTQIGFIILTFFVLIVPPAWSKDGDHPLIQSYPGSKISRSEQMKFAQYNLVTGYDTQKKELIGIPLEGTVTRNGYYHPKNRSVLEIYKNYEQALISAGAEMIFTCKNTDCSPSWASSKWNRFNGTNTFTPNNARYVAAKITNDQGKIAYIAVMVGKHRHSIDVVEIEAMEKGMVVVDAKALGRGIDQKGYVLVEGIFFDTDRAVLKSESTSALKEIAELLNDRPNLNVYVVGHTDMTGHFNHNMSLSEKRAKAVVSALVADYSISENRVAGYGVGPLAPQANNNTELGRALNRRVVLVAR